MGILNIKAYKTNSYWAVNINNLYVISRNYDTLIIGEPIQIKNKKKLGKYICITCPGRSVKASKLIAYRLFSLLKPKGRLIITYHSTISNSISSLDIHYIHDVTLLEIGIKKVKRFFPLLLNPFRTLKLLFGFKYRQFEKNDNQNIDLENFCKKRNLILEYYKVK